MPSLNHMLQADYASLERRLMCMFLITHGASVRRMLGRWVSETEPVIVLDNGRLVGLAARGMPVGVTIPAMTPAGAVLCDLWGRTTFPVEWAL